MVGKSARFLAPIALVAVAIGTYMIVHAGLATHHATASHSSSVVNGPRAPGRRSAPRPKYYVVRQGDTLSQISVKTHVSILRLSTLNPGISPNSLQTGQRLRLRR
ncbi:MAG: LysM peptidoglycan-binding domain-containing protein [Solirubrobacteraceae bacterium]